MENETKRVVGEAPGMNHDPDGVAQAGLEWVAPKLRKVDIAEITALTGNTTNDGPLSS